VLSGRDLMAGAQTGTGKTAAFALPILQRLAPLASASASPARHPVRVLVLTPTRELAVQVFESFKDYGKHMPLRSTVVYGGVDMNAQIDQLRKGVEILVATPGRLLDHVQNKTVMFNQVSVLVLDEADRMLDMGFLPDIKRIIALLPKERQNLLFSATFPDEIRALTKTLLRNPAEVQVAARNAAADSVTHVMHPVAREKKRELLSYLIQTRGLKQVLVFSGTRIGANRLAHQLQGCEVPLVPRVLTETAHRDTGIDIHPAARIGASFAIDHGTGIVIGETSNIGDRVRMYQGVTLGALSVRHRSRADKAQGNKRHPTIEDDVTIYANATILGGNTVIGKGAVVGGNAWITFSVPPGTRVGIGT